MSFTDCNHFSMSLSYWNITDKLYMLMFDIVQGSVSSYLVDMSNTCSDDRLHSASCGDFVVPRTNTKLAGKAFCVASPSAWNSLHSHIRTIDTKNRFCKQLKTHLFSL